MWQEQQKKRNFIQWKSINVKTRKWENSNVEESVQMKNLTHIFKWNSDEKFLITNWTETDCCNFECIKRSECVDCRMAIENLVLIYIRIFPISLVTLSLFHCFIIQPFVSDLPFTHTHTHWITSFRTSRCKTLDTRQWKKMYFNPATIPSILSRGRMRSGWQMKRICDDIEKW